ncbi:DoxX family protein [Streptomyces sp. NPDC056503]|uniref:DoxX family protein n=1 Tax=Streptomyces sp. NPDC056503 TaxID=3345842 RepID=UPI0036D11A3C
MTTVYWIAAVPLALFYLYGGGVKLVRGREDLLPMMAWVDTMPMSRVRALGVVEVLGAAGLVLPPPTGVAPGLAPAAALGFVVLQIGAIRVHLRGRDRDVALNVTLLLVAAVAAWAATTWW